MVGEDPQHTVAVYAAGSERPKVTVETVLINFSLQVGKQCFKVRLYLRVEPAGCMLSLPVLNAFAVIQVGGFAN